jgi:hypothetical protein
VAVSCALRPKAGSRHTPASQDDRAEIGIIEEKDTNNQSPAAMRYKDYSSV